MSGAPSQVAALEVGEHMGHERAEATALDETAPSLTSLAPEYKHEHHALYFTVIKDAIDNKPDVQNIALAGAYGSGKSSILHQLRRELDERVIVLSLLTLGAKPDTLPPSDEVNPAATSTTNRIQKEIVKQLLYQQRPADAPESRFRRISRFRWWPELRVAGVAVVVGVLLAIAIGVDVTTTPSFGIAFAPRDHWILLVASYAAGAAVLAGLVMGVRSLLRGRAAIEKLNAGPATITLPPRSSSYFDEYLDEIIYFFEMNEKVDVVIIEDLDRFNDPHIFESLRSLNGLLNTARQLDGRNIRFIYAVRDSIFGKHGQTKAEVKADQARAEVARSNRTKFFELIVPVVPFITHKNARDLMHELLTERGQAISKELISLAARHVADMRLVNNIVNEYEIFKHRLLDVDIPVPGLDPDRLFAMVVFKNAYMSEFEDIRLGKSSLDVLWDTWRDFVEANIERLENANRDLRRRITQRSAAARHARALGTRLRVAVNAVAAAQGSGLASADVRHGGHALDDNTMQSPAFWQRFVDSGSPIVLQAWRGNGYRGAGEMHLSLEAVQSLTGMTIDAKVFVASAEDVDRKAMETNDAKLRFLRRHTWEELAGQLGYSDGVVNGEPATFRDWVDQLMPSKLAADLIINGFITEYFSLHVSAFYGQLIRPDAKSYVMRFIDAGVADTEYPLTSEDVEAILLDEGTSVLTERSMLNISILDHLLRSRPDDARVVVANIPSFDPQGEFLERYFAAGAEKRALVTHLTPLLPDMFTWLATRAPLEQRERLQLIDVAAQNRAQELGYKYPEDMRTLVESGSREMPTLVGGTSAEAMARVMEVVAATGAIIPDLDGLPPRTLEAFRGTRAYALTRSNLEAVSGSMDLSLDVIKSVDGEVLAFVLENIEVYVTIVETSAATDYTVTSPDLFSEVLENAESWSSDSIPAFIKNSHPDCSIDVLTDYPAKAWPALTAFRRAPMSFENVQAYIDNYGAVTSNLAAALHDVSGVSGAENAADEERVTVALAVLNADPDHLTVGQRVRLALSLRPGELNVTDLNPLAGELIGDLIEEELIADDSDAFTERFMVDWPTQSHAMAKSRNFEDFIGPATLQPTFVRSVFADDAFTYLWPALVDALHEYAGPIPGAFTILADRVAAGEIDVDAADIELARSKGLAPERIVEMLSVSTERVPFEELTAILGRLGGKWAKVSRRGGGTHRVPATRGASDVLARLRAGGVVSSMPRDGSVFKVSLRHPR